MSCMKDDNVIRLLEIYYDAVYDEGRSEWLLATFSLFNQDRKPTSSK